MFMRAAKILTRLRGSEGSYESLPVAYICNKYQNEMWKLIFSAMSFNSSITTYRRSWLRFSIYSNLEVYPKVFWGFQKCRFNPNIEADKSL